MLCKLCGSKDFTIGESYGSHFCSNCGAVDDSNNFDHQFGGISGPEGTFVRVGTSGAGTNYSYKERKFYQSENTMNDITFRLELTNTCATEVKSMVEKITESEFGLGDWFSVLVGACSCIAMRTTNKPLTISEVAAAVGCDLYEMGAMISRVKQFLGLQLPEFDIIRLLERKIRSFSGFQGIDAHKMETMIQQGNFVIQCTIKWSLTTGRRPEQVAVAALVFIGNLNGVSVRVEDAAKEGFLSVHTCKKRYTELLKAFVEVAQKLPWGKDVNVKNIMKNAPFVLKYMGMKSMENAGKKRKALENDSQDRILSLYESEDSNISLETLARMSSKFTTMMNGGQVDQHWSNDSNLFVCNEWWTGRSELCKKLMGEELAEKDVGLDLLPPSYIRGCEKAERRKKKIKEAKARISSIACGLNNKSRVCDALVVVVENDAVVEFENGASGLKQGKRRKTKGGELDWEDFIIEALLLHQVKEEEIEKGHYNTLLDLHVFNSGVV